MTTTNVTRRLEFDAGHRVYGHESKCAHLHGHRYVAEVTVAAEVLDKISRVVDFSVVKAVVGKWIDDNWDHNILLHPDDPLLDALVPQHGCTWQDLGRLGDQMLLSKQPIFGNKKPFIMPEGSNPTAEVMAKVLFHYADNLLSSHLIRVVRVRLYETPNCWADYPGN